MKRRVYEIYDRRTGKTIEAGYRSEKEGRDAIAWAFNTGGTTEHMGLRVAS